MRKVFLLLLIPLLAFMFAACNGEKDDRIVLTYANWNLGSPDSEEPNMERLMLKAFKEKYNIKVEVIERPKEP